MATGDGDSLAIGGNHFIHVLRRNIDMNILLFNNQIYGLTKGQFSPTTPFGSVTKTSPYGTIEKSFNVGQLVIGAQGTFYARTLDNNPKHMSEVMYEAAKHDGASLVEVLQNCIIFNDKAHQLITNKETRDDHTIMLKHGEPMIFGKDRNKGLRFTPKGIEAVEIGKNGISEKDIMVHDAETDDPGLHLMLATMYPPKLPLALGVLRSVKSFTYDDLATEQLEQAKKSSEPKCMDELMNSGTVFEVK